MIRWLALVAATLALAACGTPAVVTQRVEIPIPVRPITAAELPAPPADEFAAASPADPLDAQVRALLLDRETTAAYVIRLRALVGACVGPASPAPRLPTVE
ncbi:MAG: hypothetical protein H3C26_20190 [Rhodocyclaceae bacterium]|nr:hypothetical protein [Rhodocyclaceae bacterium]